MSANMLNSEAACHGFLATRDPATIARQIKHDEESCRASKLPSLLALYLPPVDSELASAIASQLYPETTKYYRSIRMAQYSGMVQVIKAYLHQMTPLKQEKLPKFEYRTRPSIAEFETALHVLEFCTTNDAFPSFHVKTPFEDVLSGVQDYLKTKPVPDKHGLLHPHYTLRRTGPLKETRRKCYICQFRLLNAHPQYSSLCRACGDFNLASCALSLPENLRLHGKTALVTGGRLNLGYHTALRLLRCGAKVIVSTRYPRDAVLRYRAEKDSGAWCDRLKIIGADFRAASDVFHLVAIVQGQLREWDENAVGKLDILVNNAAQTLTDPVEKEKQAVFKEKKLFLEGTGSKSQILIAVSGYEARIRGGAQPSKLLDVPKQQIEGRLEGNPVSKSQSGSIVPSQPPENTSLATREIQLKSSWMQSILEIPYEDIISAHSVNTFVPLILIRELLPLMGSTNHSSSPPSPSSSSPTSSSEPSTKPLAHIINVTSREGIFKSNPTSASKNGHHVHTNLTKAALNMLTETEATPAWRQRRVAMNSVDPGYMSAAPEIEKYWKEMSEKEGEGGGKEKSRWGCPIGWKDGAGRVLWPIAVGEQGIGVWGRFLKHFGGVEYDVSVGR